MTDEKQLPLQQHSVIEKAKFTYSFFGKAFEKQKKKQLKNRGKHAEALQSLYITNNKINEFQSIEDAYPKFLLNNEVEYKIVPIRGIGQEVDRGNLINKMGDTKTCRVFGFLNIPLDFLSCFAVVLRGILGIA